MASNSSDIPAMQLVVFGDHESRLEEANPQGTGGDECLEGMELAVYYAAKEGNIDALSEYRERLHQILTPTRNTVLHIYIACAMSTNPKEVNSSETVKKILEMCPPLLLQSNTIGDTALHIAARYGRTAIVNTIMQVAKMDRDGGGAWPRILSATNVEGNTALHEAVRFNHSGVVMMLTTDNDHQQAFYSANVAGETLLYLAAERGYCDLVHQIIHSCPEAAYQGPNGRTALHAAVIRNDKEMTEKLLEYKGVLTKEVDECGCTPLHLAASLGYTSVVTQLLMHDRSAAYVREKDQKRTALHFAASKGHIEVIAVLIVFCPDLCELVDEKSHNVLHSSIMAEKEDTMVPFVLNDPWLSNILLNGKDENGDTPLHQIADTSSMRVSTAFVTDARVDKMTFNKENQNAFDILLQSEGDYYFSSTQGELKDKLTRNGAIPGCRIVRNKKEVDNTVNKKMSEEEQNNMKDSHLVVAMLIATVSFTAGFTMPGGYQSDKGSNQGSAILSTNAAFQAFVITNTMAMSLSSCSVLLHLYAIANRKRKVVTEADMLLYTFTMLALIAMVIAFITGTYAVLGHYSRLGITVCVLGIIIFFVLVEFMVYDERGIVDTNTPLLPLSLSCLLCSWMGLKMWYAIRKLYYQCLRLVSPASKGKLSKHKVSNCSTSQSCPEMDRQMIVYDKC